MQPPVASTILLSILALVACTTLADPTEFASYQTHDLSARGPEAATEALYEALDLEARSADPEAEAKADYDDQEIFARYADPSADASLDDTDAEFPLYTRSLDNLDLFSRDVLPLDTEEGLQRRSGRGRGGRGGRGGGRFAGGAGGAGGGAAAGGASQPGRGRFPRLRQAASRVISGMRPGGQRPPMTPEEAHRGEIEAAHMANIKALANSYRGGSKSSKMCHAKCYYVHMVLKTDQLGHYGCMRNYCIYA
ncbi:hypothetical protein MMC17_008616 [Xylographa soralifera]|nr:hypothetical protein [Xylographa soralifera]